MWLRVGAHCARARVGDAASELHPAVVWTLSVGEGAVEGSSDGGHGVDAHGRASKHGAAGETAAGEAGPASGAFRRPRTHLARGSAGPVCLRLAVEEVASTLEGLCSPSS